MSVIKITHRQVERLRWIARQRSTRPGASLAAELNLRAKKFGFRNWSNLMYHYRKQHAHENPEAGREVQDLVD